MLAPQLVQEEFDQKGIAVVSCQFAGRRLTVEYHNPKRLDAAKYVIKEALVDGKPLSFKRIAPDRALIQRSRITKDALIKVILG